MEIDFHRQLVDIRRAATILISRIEQMEEHRVNIMASLGNPALGTDDGTTRAVQPVRGKTRRKGGKVVAPSGKDVQNEEWGLGDQIGLDTSGDGSR